MKSQLHEYKEEISKLEKYKESLSNLKQYIALYMPLSPLIEEYANAVEGKREIQAGNSFRGLLTALGELLNSFNGVDSGWNLLVSKINAVADK